MRKFTEDFKREAVRLVQTRGRTIEQVADALGIGRSTLGKWLAKHVMQICCRVRTKTLPRN
ncbi:transposase [Magnetospirillum sp. J10]|uniref:Transposase n=1 Tax=Magnetospirillum sulfuroxidans TaxID=611300 RepID=A0ABS5ICH2_9PROT|nr:transposase [Magnetospirillum sulfuroxidans]